MPERRSPTTRGKNLQEDEELLSMMRGDAPDATPDQLERIRALAREMRDAGLQNADLADKIKRNNERIEEIRWHDLLDAMDAAGMRALTLEAEGNLPAYEVRTGAYYHANIAADWEPEKREKAFSWLDKHEPGMLRSTMTLEFGRGSRALQKKAEAALRKLKIPFRRELGVPWNTLTSFVKEQIEEHKKTPPLELLGAKVGRVATIKKV